MSSRPTFRKRVPVAGMAELEAAGLRWLGTCGARVPTVHSVTPEGLEMDRVATVAATSDAARAAGAMLARMHRTTAASFGNPPPGTGAEMGWVGLLPVPFGDHATWPEHYVHDRLRPAAAAAVSSGGLDPDDESAVRRLCDRLLADPLKITGPGGPPAVIHGDLWSGNVLWVADGAVLIDPAAVSGHPETDLAMLHLFGLPHLTHFLEGYQEVSVLDPGWPTRIPLHQVFPLLVHAALFGGSYGPAAARAAVSALA